MKKNVFFLIFIFSFSSLYGQGNEEQIKTQLIFQIAKEIIWQEKVLFPKLSIGIINDPKLELAFEYHAFTATRISTLKDIKDIDILYVSNSNSFDWQSIYDSINGKGILLITEMSEMPEKTMINFIRDQEKIKFDVNEKLLQDNGFKVNSILLKMARSKFIIGIKSNVNNEKYELFKGDTVNRIDDLGLKQGKWILFSKQIKQIDQYTDLEINYVASEGIFVNSKKEGTWKKYYPDGNLESEITFQSGKPEGAYRTYYENGKVTEEGLWNKNKPVGEFKRYYENGNLNQHFNFNKNGMREGVQKYYYENGSMQFEGTWVNGNEQGIIKKYDTEGSLISEILFESGVKKSEKIYNSNESEKTTELTKEKESEKDTPPASSTFTGNGYSKLFTKNKKVSKEGTFANYMLISGKHYIYDNDNNLMRTEIYEDGKLSGYELSDGRVVTSLDGEYTGLEDIREMENFFKNLLKKKETEITEIKENLEKSKLQNDLLLKDRQIKDLVLAKQNALALQQKAEIARQKLEVENRSKILVYLSQEKELKDFELRQKEMESDAREKEIILLNQEKEFQDIELEYQKNARNYVTAGLGMFLLLSLLIFRGYRQKRKDNTALAMQKRLVEEKQKEILDSINYAKRIQAAILPPSRIVKEMLPDSFIIYKPKDIVAGDFYWMHLSLNPSPRGEGKAVLTSDGTAEDQSPLSPGRCAGGEVVFFAAADCTGHGVPGAMVSVICNNGLNRSVREYGLTDPGKILDKTREIVIQEFEKSDEEVKDGMDISICALEALPSTQSSQKMAGVRLHYAGANNPLWVIRRDRHPELVSGSQEMLAQVGHDKDLKPETLNFELHEVKADKQPIGKYSENKPFTTHTLELQKGDTIYIFTDGYADQFGGEAGKKFKSANFKKLLLSIQDKSMDEQQQIITETFNTWKGETEQVDDVCLIGVRI
jgi:antitoxin component YwqK of YwqJK toxin-antitoxin module/serine phosphatase RsbU (regulator of sigma subunit)